MKKFYLYRLEDVNGNSGCGTVAEGVIFDTGTVAMTWLSTFSSLTFFSSIRDVKKIHSHEGKTVVVIEGQKRGKYDYIQCENEASLKKKSLK